MKYKQRSGTPYVQVNRNIFNGQYPSLSKNAKWLYCVLSDLEHSYTGAEEDFFFYPLESLAKNAKMNRNYTLKARRELEKVGLVQTWQMHWINKETGKKSGRHVTAYRLH